MEAPEQVMGSHSSSSTGECPSPPSPPPPPPPTATTTTTTTTPSPAAVAPFKRKRTKLLRSFPTNFPSSSSTSSLEQLPNAADATTTTTTTEEEEDMAHCLILLAQGRALQSPPPSSGTQTPVVTPTEKFTSRKFSETVTTAGGKAGFYVYECKTCNKCFPSFQALGGHRASHKKPKNMTVSMADFEDKKQQLSIGGDHLQDHHHQIQIQGGGDVNMNMNINMNMKAVVVSSPNSACKVQRVHECSICGAEFSSGQALGGHMRRHRPIIQAGHDSQHVKKENSAASSNNNLQNSHNNSNVLTLDLNLPAPSEDLNSATTTEAFRPMVFSSALVDCHY